MRHMLLSSALALLCPVAAHSAVRLPAMMTDHLVLQQNAQVRLWGQADGRQVSVTTSWDGRTYTAKPDADGNWSVSVGTPAAGYTPYEITITDGDAPARISDVLVGEVWVCSGQSNMEMAMKGFPAQPVEGAMDALMGATAYRDKVRFITVPKTTDATLRRDFEGQWAAASPDTAPDCSAVAYFYGTQLADALDVPVGLVITNWGGSAMESWMSPQTLADFGFAVPADDASKPFQHQCSTLYNSMLSPVIGYGARGFIWYQGESNLHNSSIYAELQRAMVDEWRTEWGNAEMPFYYVLIAPYNYTNPDGFEAALVREQQVRALDIIPHSGIAGTLDIGEPGCIHPAKKRPVSQRLAALALSKTYGMTRLPAEAPRMSDVELQDSVAIVTFGNVGNGLTPLYGPVAGFEVAGADGVFHPAKAHCMNRGNRVRVWADEVKEPKYVRYGFRNYTGELNLKDTTGNSALPFRTDDFKE